MVGTNVGPVIAANIVFDIENRPKKAFLKIVGYMFLGGSSDPRE